MSDIKAIETQYKGYRFRSRLETRWAVFFDALDIEWEYEKEGYDLGDAGWYLPDFWLPHLRVFFEVKPTWQSLVPEERKFIALCEKSSIIVAFDMPWQSPYLTPYGLVYERGAIVRNSAQYAFRWMFTDHAMGLLYGGESYYFWRGHDAIFEVSHSGVNEYHKFMSLAESEQIVNAFNAARSARFEHGETPMVGHRS